jgi:hypothetical protein
MRHLLLTLVALAASTTALAEDRTLCVYDPMGTNGVAYQTAASWKVPVAEKWGVNLVLRAYIEEKTAGDDLAAGKCDGAVFTGVRARSFGLKSATIEAIGALPTYNSLQFAIYNLQRPEAATLMTTGSYETAGIYPGGAVYLFVRDASIRKASQLAGKKISVIAGDDAALTMIREVGASGISSSTADFGSKFNSGSVDAAYAPATAYKPLELYRGLGSGGVIDFVLSQLTLQVVIKADRFPAGFGQWGRERAYGQFDEVLRKVTAAEAEVKAKMLAIPEEDKPGYDQKFQAVRVSMRDKGVYDKGVLKVMKNIRCQIWKTRAECATSVE